MSEHVRARVVERALGAAGAGRPERRRPRRLCRRPSPPGEEACSTPSRSGGSIAGRASTAPSRRSPRRRASCSTSWATAPSGPRSSASRTRPAWRAACASTATSATSGPSSRAPACSSPRRAPRGSASRCSRAWPWGAPSSASRPGACPRSSAPWTTPSARRAGSPGARRAGRARRGPARGPRDPAPCATGRAGARPRARALLRGRHARRLLPPSTPTSSTKPRRARPRQPPRRSPRRRSGRPAAGGSSAARRRRARP